MAVKNRLLPIPMITFNAATLTGSYVAMSATGLGNACCFLRISNKSNRDLTISYDGVTDHDFLLIDTTLYIPGQLNAQPNNWVALWPKGQIIYLKAAAGAGNVYLTGYYQPNLN